MDWLELHKSLQILETHSLRFIQTTDDDFDRLESQYNFQLPLDNRAFVKVFGPDQLTCDYMFRSVGSHIFFLSDRAQSNEQIDVVALNTVLRELTETSEAFDGPYSIQARRSVYFAGNTAGDCVGWDPEEYRNTEIPSTESTWLERFPLWSRIHVSPPRKQGAGSQVKLPLACAAG